RSRAGYPPPLLRRWGRAPQAAYRPPLQWRVGPAPQAAYMPPLQWRPNPIPPPKSLGAPASLPAPSAPPQYQLASMAAIAALDLHPDTFANLTNRCLDPHRSPARLLIVHHLFEMADRMNPSRKVCRSSSIA